MSPQRSRAQAGDNPVDTAVFPSWTGAVDRWFTCPERSSTGPSTPSWGVDSAADLGRYRLSPPSTAPTKTSEDNFLSLQDTTLWGRTRPVHDLTTMEIR